MTTVARPEERCHVCNGTHAFWYKGRMVRIYSDDVVNCTWNNGATTHLVIPGGLPFCKVCAMECLTGVLPMLEAYGIYLEVKENE